MAAAGLFGAQRRRSGAAGRASVGAGLGADAISAAQGTLGVEAGGVVGSRTRSAVKRSNGLTADGIIGPQTMKALGVYPQAAQAQAASADSLRADSRVRVRRRAGGGLRHGALPRQVPVRSGDVAAPRRHGDPAAAPEVDEDAMSAKLFAQAGAVPWPSCA